MTNEKSDSQPNNLLLRSGNNPAAPEHVELIDYSHDSAQLKIEQDLGQAVTGNGLLSHVYDELYALQRADGGGATLKFQQDLYEISLHTGDILPSSFYISGLDVENKAIELTSEDTPGVFELRQDHGLVSPVLKVATDSNGEHVDADMESKSLASLLPFDRSKNPLACDVNQGDLGDCYFESTVAALAELDPQAIKNMIVHNFSDDSYTVTFPGDPLHPVTVAAPTDGERAIFNHSYEKDLCSVLEKAHRAYTHKDLNDKGGWVPDAMQLLTGFHARGLRVAYFDSDALSKLLEAGLKDRSLLTASTWPIPHGLVLGLGPISPHIITDSASAGDGPVFKGLKPQHVYTICGYDPISKTVTLRNPGGFDDSEYRQLGDGIIAMPLGEFQKQFQGLFVGKTQSSSVG